MQNRRHHYFDDCDDVVITVLLPTGEYGATRENADEGRIRGHGTTRIGAIADMIEELKGDDDATFDRDR
jgi:hypothetical protein